jgi:tetratricopeptide (TPR) repeat protein
MRQLTSLVAVLSFLFLGPQAVSPQSAARENHRASSRATPGKGYIGSEACSRCHALIAARYARTQMGLSMSPVTPRLLKALPNRASVFSRELNRHFSVFVENGQLYQSEWETGEDGKDVFRRTERIEWIMGAGANAMGGVIRQGDQLFEAPLTYYEKTRAWALSPGYEEADRGFSRPIEAACIFCHSGRANPTAGAVGRFASPPFDELAIGCENCHGPGAAHIRQMREGRQGAGARSHSIVNPAKLSPWLADNICMSCHQNGDARVLEPGKDFKDFEAGQPLDHTLAILMAPPTRASPPDSDHVQHYFSMILSKCYRKSSELSCIRCHDPHQQPSGEEAARYFKKKCLSCHTEASCALGKKAREESQAGDDCVGCHMPKRDVAIISHASLTNHRIVTTPGEPFPDATFEMATAELPDLVHLNAIPGEAKGVPLGTQLQAYGQLAVGRREYLQRYFEVALALESSEPDNTDVLEALAARCFGQRTPEGDRDGLQYLERAAEHGSISAWNFEQLGGRLLKEHRFEEARSRLQLGIRRAPYDAALYALLANAYIHLSQPQEALATLRLASERFPEVDMLRQLLHELEPSPEPDGP